MVKVFVGPKRKLWHLNEDLLCDRSPYFKAAFKGGFAEATAKESYLEDADPEAFGLLVDWVYGRTLHPVRETLWPALTNQLLLLLKLYNIADFLGIEVLMNLSLDLYSCSLKHDYPLPGVSHLLYASNHLAATSQARKLVIYSIALHLTTYDKSSPYLTALENNAEIAPDVIKAMRYYIFCPPEKKIFPDCEPACNYHVHRLTEKCKET